MKEAFYQLPKNLSFAAACGLPNFLPLVLITRTSVHNHESAAARPVLDYLSRVSQAESCRKAVL